MQWLRMQISSVPLCPREKVCQKVYEIYKKIKEHLVNVMNKMGNDLKYYH